MDGPFYYVTGYGNYIAKQRFAKILFHVWGPTPRCALELEIKTDNSIKTNPRDHGLRILTMKDTLQPSLSMAMVQSEL